MTGRSPAAVCARRSASTSFGPVTLAERRALTPITTSRLREMAPRARSTLARFRSCSSPLGATPVRAMLTKQRPICGACRATAATASMLSAPPEPASTHPVTPSCRHMGGPSLLRPAWVWMSMRPGATILLRASIVSLASPAILASIVAIFPPAIATSRMASIPTEGSMTRPPLIIRSYVAANAFGARPNNTELAAAVHTNWLRFIMVVLQCDKTRSALRTPRSTLISGAPPPRRPLRGTRLTFAESKQTRCVTRLKGNPTADERLPPSHLRRNRRAFGQCPQLRPHDAAVDPAGKRALRESAIGTGHQVVATDALGKTREPLGHELRMLDDVG